MDIATHRPSNVASILLMKMENISQKALKSIADVYRVTTKREAKVPGSI